MAAGIEFSDLSWTAILVAMLMNIVLGFLWYSPKLPTGRIWMKGMGMSMDDKPEPAEMKRMMMKGMVLMVIGTFLLMFVFAHNVTAYHDAYKLDGARMDGLTVMDGVQGGFFTWLGFFVPMLLSGVAWEKKPWSLFTVNAGYYLVTMVLAGIIMVTM